jgi:hypothetical protein
MPPAAAQTIYTGELTGNVTDPSGRIIAGAMVEKASIATGGTGEFRFPLLRPGPYTLAVSAAGFETKIQRTTVELGQSSDASPGRPSPSIFLGQSRMRHVHAILATYSK